MWSLYCEVNLSVAKQALFKERCIFFFSNFLSTYEIKNKKKITADVTPRRRGGGGGGRSYFETRKPGAEPVKSHKKKRFSNCDLNRRARAHGIVREWVSRRTRAVGRTNAANKAPPLPRRHPLPCAARTYELGTDGVGARALVRRRSVRRDPDPVRRVTLYYNNISASHYAASLAGGGRAERLCD